tara:strand:- start:1961 stop:5521 length:3561 start_codon:yes stop_codon:yes gene_type:complete
MIELPKYFARGIDGQTARLKSIVHIFTQATTDTPLEEQDLQLSDAVKISTHDTVLTYEENSSKHTAQYSPILKTFPIIQDKLDVINSEHKISNSKLQLYNVSTTIDINGTKVEGIVSDLVEQLLGSVVQVYYMIEETRHLQDCLLVYTGVIKRYKQTKKEVSLDLEDLSSIKYSVAIPTALMPFDETVREEDRGKPYPMPYGYVRYAPTRQFTTSGHTGGFQIEGFAMDRPDSNIGGVVESIDEYEFNADLQNWTHNLNYQYGTTPFARDNSDVPYEKDFLYVWDNEMIHLSKVSLNQMGITQVDGDPCDMFLNRGKKMYFYQQETNSVRFTTDYFDEMNMLYQKWLEEESKDDTEDNPNPYSRIEFNPNCIFTRIYRPVRKINFFGRPHLNSTYNFYGIGQSHNNGIAWQPYGNEEALPNTDEYTVEALTDEQYEENWKIWGDHNWWRCDETHEAGGTSDMIHGTTDNNWTINNFSGPYNEVGEFPVNYIQNGDHTQGLYIEAFTEDVNAVPYGYANLVLTEHKSSLPCETKIYTVIQHSFDHTSQKGYKRDYGNTYNYTGITGFTNVQKAKSQLSDWIGFYHQTYQSQVAHKYLFYYFQASNAFDAPFPYGPYLGDWEPLDVPSWQLNADNPAYGFGTYDHGGNEDWTGHLADNRFDKLNYAKDYNVMTPAYYNNSHGSERQSFYSKAFLKEFYMFQDVIVTEPLEKEYFVNLAGRVSSYDNVISAPHSILQDIMEKEVNFYNHFENIEDVDDELMDWVMSFSQIEQIPLKEFMSEMFKSTLCTVTFVNNGKLKLFTHRRYLNTGINITSSLIRARDVISYTFSLTKNDEVANRINVRYDWVESSGEFQKETGFSIKNSVGDEYETLDDFNATHYPSLPYNLEYYNLYNIEGTKTFDTKFIADDNTARKLQRKLLMWHCNQHLKLAITLPLKYLAFEIGDYVEFDSLINNEKAFGWDYTKDTARNGQLVYNKFVIVDCKKTADKVTLELIQCHRLELGFPENYLTNNWVENGEIWTEDGTDISNKFLVPPGLVPDEDTIITEDDWEEYDTEQDYGDYLTCNWVQYYPEDTAESKVTLGESVIAQFLSNAYSNTFYKIILTGVSAHINIEGDIFSPDENYTHLANDHFNVSIEDINPVLNRVTFTPTYETGDVEISYKILLSGITFDNTGGGEDDILDIVIGDIG